MRREPGERPRGGNDEKEIGVSGCIVTVLVAMPATVGATA